MLLGWTSQLDPQTSGKRSRNCKKLQTIPSKPPLWRIMKTLSGPLKINAMPWRVTSLTSQKTQQTCQNPYKEPQLPHQTQPIQKQNQQPFTSPTSLLPLPLPAC